MSTLTSEIRGSSLGISSSSLIEDFFSIEALIYKGFSYSSFSFSTGMADTSEIELFLLNYLDFILSETLS